MGLSAYTQSLSDWSVRSLAQVQPELNNSPLPRRLFADTCNELYLWPAPFSYQTIVSKLGFGNASTEKGVKLGAGWLMFRPYSRFTPWDPTYATESPIVPICRSNVMFHCCK